jgi:polar amino acid transport system substrate-binding protein
MKKMLSLIITCIAALSIVLAGCSAQNGSTDQNGASDGNLKGIGTVKQNKEIYNSLPERIKKSKEIINGIDDSYPPMDFRDDNNNLVGFDIDIDRALSAKLGVQIKNVPTDWSGIIPSLQNKKLDMILSALGITKDREKSVSFSKPYFMGGMTVISNKKNKHPIKNDKDLKGKVVGVQLGAQAIVDYAEKVPGIKDVKKYDKTTEGLQDLANGRIDAYIDDFQIASYYMTKVPGQYVKHELGVEEPYGIAFRKDDKKLQDSVQKAFDELKQEGVLSKISKKWFGEDIYK